jgi:hypothetical protein
MKMEDAERLEETVDRFCQFIALLPAGSLVEQDWGPVEVLAHLVYHHERYVNSIEAGVTRTPLSLYEGTFREMNALAIASLRGILSSDLVARLQKANQRLIELYQLYNPDDIVIIIKSGARPRTLRALLPEVEAHIRNHLRKLLSPSKQKALSRSGL